jgi:polyhydroxybutyrate depolymerase
MTFTIAQIPPFFRFSRLFRRSTARALFVATTLSASCAAASGFAPGDHLLRLTHDGQARSAIVHVPPQAARGLPLPVVLNFHGASGDARSHQQYVGMDRLADRVGFVVVYPNGTGPIPDQLLTWNAGACCGPAQADGVDDVGFVRALLDEIPRHLAADPARIYATGLSNGAMLTYRLAAEAPERFAAIASVAGAMALVPFAPRAPISILHIHSVDDPLTRYAGGLGPPFSPGETRAMHAPVAETLARWRGFMGCPAQPITTAERREPGGSAAARQSATRLLWSPCRRGTEIVHWRLTGVGHVWPGSKRIYVQGVFGPPTDVIDANLEIWQFFRRHTLTQHR